MLRGITYFTAILCFLTKCAAACFNDCGAEQDFAAASKVFLVLYKGSPENFLPIRVPAERPESIKELINLNKSVVVYSHGFLEDAESRTVRTIVEAYLGRGDVNIIVLDWGSLAGDIIYPLVSQRVPLVGLTLARSLIKLSDVIDPAAIHLVGHSLGSHVMGFTGRFLQMMKDVAPRRITGLDPAYPEFYPSRCHLGPGDAKLVVALHTDPGFYGTPFDTASIDFYANKDCLFQPGCGLPLELCSHQRSVEYFAVSIKHPKMFPSRPRNDKDTSPDVYFSDRVPEDARGKRFFNTTAVFPYGEEIREM